MCELYVPHGERSVSFVLHFSVGLAFILDMPLENLDLLSNEISCLSDVMLC